MNIFQDMLKKRISDLFRLKMRYSFFLYRKVTVIETINTIFRLPELRNRILFTLAMLSIYRLGIFIPALRCRSKCSV